jgi:hypothetical protein
LYIFYTMARILGKKIGGGVPVDELLGAGVLKPVFEGALAPYVGNGNVISGGVKLGAALALPSIAGSGKFVRITQLALGVDGAEDLMRGLLGGFIPAIGGGGSAVSDPFREAM